MLGCQSSLDQNLISATEVGRYGGARVALQENLDQDTSDRNYILGRLRLLILTLADGQPQAAEVVVGETFRLLSTQGINSDRTVSSAVINESVKIWKGEPFEQAFGYSYISIQKAMLGEWDNARAAANNSLFLLKDFSDNERADTRPARTSGAQLRGRRTGDVSRRPTAASSRSMNGREPAVGATYAAIESNFGLGHLLAAIAARALGRDDEATEHLNAAAAINPSARPVALALAENNYNTVFVIDVGPGPAKVTYGPDNSLARFEPRQYSSPQTVTAQVISPAGTSSTSAPVGYSPITDVNQMAASATWNNLENFRSVKSLLGTALVGGGAGVAVASDDDEARMAGLIGLGLGLLLKASSSADTRYCEFLPQSVYIVPVMIPSAGSLVTLSAGASQVTLTDLAPPPANAGTLPLQLRYVRMVQATPAPAWALSQFTVYANDRSSGRVPGDEMPFLMGGRCVRYPDARTMGYYHSQGNLTDLTASDLATLYREEGITFTAEDQRGGSRKHILEGGDSLLCPLAGTTGYKRLFGQIHPPYQPRSAALRDYIERHSATARTTLPP